MRNSGGFLKVGMIIFLFLACIPNALAGIKSGDIVYVSPDPLYCEGATESVTVCIRNTGDSGNMTITIAPIFNGWHVEPPSKNVYVSSGSYFTTTFNVIPPPPDGTHLVT